MTPPYFHDGSVDHLADAVVIMAKVQLAKLHSKPNPTRSGDIHADR
jgi:cytochrome c peroxidase